MTTLRSETQQGLDVATRVGLVAYGGMHLLVAWIAAELALGERNGDSSGQGALRQLAHQPLGRVLVWAIAVALLGFCLRRAVEGCFGHRDEDSRERWMHRARAWGKALVYGAVGVSAVSIASGSGGGGGSAKERSLSARAMDLPAGGLLVAAVGAVILAVGAHHAYRGVTQDFREELSAHGRSGDSGTLYLAFGQIGYTAKGVVIALAGLLVGYAGLAHDPQKSGGLDEALRTVRNQPFGPALLLAVAAGIACYGLFCFAQARHLSR